MAALALGFTSLIPEPTHYPMPNMERFGKNPYGQPLYRVVFAPSCKMLVGGKWKDGAIEYRARPAYRHIGQEWILERWLSAYDFTKMTREQYEVRYRDSSTGLFTCGPYPERGAYFMCGDAPLASPGDGGIEKLIGWIEKGRRNDPRENQQAILDDHAKNEKAQDSELLAQIQETRPSFGTRPTSFPGHVHSLKSHRIVKSAESTGLPIGNNKLAVTTGRK